MSVGVHEDYWLAIHFKLRLYEAAGDAFQRLVADVLTAQHPDFVPVRPSGSVGDHGNDGYVPSLGVFFQVYGPAASSYVSEREAARKARADFAKLQRHYPDMKAYRFVLNDRFQGIPASVLDELNAMQRETGIPCQAVGAGHILSMFRGLAADARKLIVQGVPAELPDWIDPRALGEVLEHLAHHDAGWGNIAKRVAPDFENKIRFNGLEGFAADRLRSLSYQVGSVDDFFRVRDPSLAQAVAHELRALYAESAHSIADTDEDAPALRYVWMIERIIPPAARPHPFMLKAYREAAEVVLAKYFETCDVYDAPGTGGRAA